MNTESFGTIDPDISDEALEAAAGLFPGAITECMCRVAQPTL